MLPYEIILQFILHCDSNKKSFKSLRHIVNNFKRVVIDKVDFYFVFLFTPHGQKDRLVSKKTALSENVHAL